VGDAAVDQQRLMRESYVSFANHISSAAQRENATWPMFRIPDYELHAGQVRLQSGSEVIGCTYFVDADDGDEYLKFVTNNYVNSINEGHMTRYGNLDRLVPKGYTENFTVRGPNGFLPDTMYAPLRLPKWQSSPRKYLFVD
jgi:hypothetical protein